MKPSPEPDRSQLETFVRVVFKHATAGNFISLRAFPDQGGNSKPFRTAVKLDGNLDALIDQAYRIAELAAQAPDKFVFCPPVATFNNARHAREQDLVEGLVLSIECDAHPQAAQKKLGKLLGPPTLVVESGGMWLNPETSETEPKLHLYWLLKVPACSKNELARLKEARRLATKLAGSDGSNVTIVHPIRWPGSLHRKGEPKLCRITSVTDNEIDLDAALEILRKAAGDDKPHLTTNTPDTTPIEVAERFRHLDPRHTLNDSIVLREIPLLPFEPIKAECAWLHTAYETGGKDFDYPQWHLTTLCSTFLEDGQDLAHWFGYQHPDYVPEKTDEFWERKDRERRTSDIGWPYCQTIHDNGGKPHCEKCPHFAKKKSPLHLALQAPAPPPLPGQKPPLIVELGSRLWGPATINGNEYRFGEDQSKVIDPRKGSWFDFTANKGGHIRELMKRVEAEANRKQPNADDVVAICAADVVIRPLDWIWPGHLLRGAQELMSGLPDLCKSQVQIHLIACATTKQPWPDGAPAVEPMNVIMLTAEDTVDQIIKPRLIAAGADINRVHILKAIKTDERDRQFFMGEDLYRLECLVKKIGSVGLITFDPITAYMGGKIDSYKATEVRSQLGPLKDFAERTNIAVSTITHPAKHAGLRALDHFIASQAFIAACRIGHLCIPEMEEGEGGEQKPTGRILFTTVRHSHSKWMSTLVYSKETVPVSGAGDVPRVTWEGEINITADAAVAAASGKKSDQQLKLQAFLREILKDGKPVAQKEIEEAGAAKGFTSKQLRTAREKLGIHVDKESGKMGGGWFWQLPNPDEGRYHY